MKKIALALFALIFGFAPAQAKDTLTIYTYDSFVADWGPGPKVKEAFEKTCDCTIEWVAPGDAVTVLNRLKLEGKATKADLVLGLDTNLTAEAKDTGLFDTHGLDVKLAKTPVAWTDDTFMPFDFGYFAVVYDSDKIKPYASLDALVTGYPEQKIALEDPRSSTPGLGLLLWMKSVYGEKSADAWRRLKDRVLTVAPGWSEAYALFTKGEAPMVLSYTTSPAYHIIAEKKTQYAADDFPEGHYLQVEVAGVTAHAPHPALARRFLQFMLSAKFQDVIPETNWMYPAAATSAPLPSAFPPLPGKSLLIPSAEVAQHRKAWIEEWLAAMSQ